MIGSTVRTLMDAIVAASRDSEPRVFAIPHANVPTMCCRPGRTHDSRQYIPMVMCVEYPRLGRWLEWLSKNDGGWERSFTMDVYLGPQWPDEGEPSWLTWVSDSEETSRATA